jgi:integrase
VGFSRKRVGRDGTITWQAMYRDARGRQPSAGTHPTRKAADKAWQHAEALLTAGRPDDARARRITFEDYVAVHWFPNHILEPTTRESYRYNLQRHIVPWFGPMRIADIMPIHVREWVSELVSRGVSPATIRHQKIILSAIFTTALNDYVVTLHPCKGVKTPTVPVKEYRILQPDEVARLLLALPHDPARLLIDTAIGSGLRWGELTELRPADLHMLSGILTVTRTVTELSPTDHPAGGRFLVKPYPKTKRSRRLRLHPTLIETLGIHVRAHAIGAHDLLFPVSLAGAQSGTSAVDPTGPVSSAYKDHGYTEPNTAGRTYRHGTLSAYTACACRCPHCRAAFTEYRAHRRAIGLDEPRRPRTGPDSDGHLPRNHWRTQVWLPSCAVARLSPAPRMHDLRHSHASWLLAGGADLQVVRERLGHQSIATTEKYLHTLPTADATALDALDRIRYGQ